jgi:hypothetical protein
MATLTFGLVGLSILPLFLFYLAFTLDKRLWFMRLFLIPLAIFCVMLILNELILNYPTASGPATVLFSGVTMLLVFYMALELFNFLYICKDALDKVIKGRDYGRQ